MAMEVAAFFHSGPEQGSGGRRQRGIANISQPKQRWSVMKVTLRPRDDTASDTLAGRGPSLKETSVCITCCEASVPRALPHASGAGTQPSQRTLQPCGHPNTPKGRCENTQRQFRGEIWSSEHGLSGIVNKIIITPNFFHGGEHHYPLAKLLRDPWANAWHLIYHSCHNYEKHCPFPGTQKLCLRGCIVWQEDGLASDRSKFKAEPSLTVCVIMGKAT